MTDLMNLRFPKAGHGILHQTMPGSLVSPLSYSSKIMAEHYSAHITEFPVSSFEKLCALALPHILKGKPTIEKELTICGCRYISWPLQPDVIFTMQRRAALISSNGEVPHMIFTKNEVSFEASSFPSALNDATSMLSMKEK